MLFDIELNTSGTAIDAFGNNLGNANIKMIDSRSFNSLIWRRRQIGSRKMRKYREKNYNNGE